MALCGVMRVEKRQVRAVGGLENEANRSADKDMGKFPNSDIDRAKTQENIYLKKTDEWRKNINQVIKKSGLKARKNSVVMLDGVYTASPEFFKGKTDDEVKEYFEDCLSFHIKEFCQGNPERLINAVIHLDETTPHMQVASVPIVEDEKGMHLSAKILMGTNRVYRERQNKFYEEVTKNWGLERGEIKLDPKEKKQHLTKREWQSQQLSEKIESQKEELNNVKARVLDEYEYVRTIKIMMDDLIKNFSDLPFSEKEKKVINIDTRITTNMVLLNKQLINLDKLYKANRSILDKNQSVVKELENHQKNAKEVESIIAKKDELLNEVESLKLDINNLVMEKEKSLKYKDLKGFAYKNRELFDEFIKQKEMNLDER